MSPMSTTSWQEWLLWGWLAAVNALVLLHLFDKDRHN